MVTPQNLIGKVKDKFVDCVLETSDKLGEATVSVRPDCIVDLLQFLRDDPELSFNFLMDVCGADLIDLNLFERYAVVYHLYSMEHNHRIRIKAFVSEQELSIDSVSHLWEAANWAEREVYDMYGIEFKNHPDLRRILNPDNFEGFPLRKDFPPEGIGYREDFEKIKRSDAQ